LQNDAQENAVPDGDQPADILVPVWNKGKEVVLTPQALVLFSRHTPTTFERLEAEMGERIN